MNITERISKQIGGDFEKIINENKEIQIYYWHDGYAWRDSRNLETSNIDNQRGLTEKQLFKELKKL